MFTTDGFKNGRRNNQCYKSTQLKLHCSQTGCSVIDTATLILLISHAGKEHITVYYVMSNNEVYHYTTLAHVS